MGGRVWLGLLAWVVLGSSDMQRIHDIYRPTEERRNDWREVERALTDEELKEQTSRCMNCGQPFCHAYGCPLGNLVPDQNRAVAQGDWKRAYDLLSVNSDFPEFTSRICPALCEASCVHGLDEEANPAAFAAIAGALAYAHHNYAEKSVFGFERILKGLFK